MNFLKNYYELTEQNFEKNDLEAIKDLIDSDESMINISKSETLKLNFKNIYFFQNPDIFIKGNIFCTDFKVEFVSADDNKKVFLF
jgi:hypothetical protein